MEINVEEKDFGKRLDVFLLEKYSNFSRNNIQNNLKQKNSYLLRNGKKLFKSGEILKAGGLTGGFNFDAKNRRPSYTYEDMFAGYILGMDTFALGLIKAAALIEDGRLDENIKERYSSYHTTEIGKKIISGKTTLAELAAYADKLGAPALPGSGKQEILQNIVNGVLYGK